MRHFKGQCLGLHCRCMQKDCSNFHYADHVQENGFTATEINNKSAVAVLEFLHVEFEKFYAASPFAGSDERIKIAMQGSFVAGYTLGADTILKQINSTLDKNRG